MNKLTKELILENVTKGGYLTKRFLISNDTTKEECYILMHGAGKCIYCGEVPRFNNFKSGYFTTCKDSRCGDKKRRKTNLEKYGVECVAQIKEVRAKVAASIKKTNLERYNVECVFQIKELMTDDNGNHCSQSTTARTRRKATLIERHGTDDPLSINSGRERGLAKCNSEEVRLKRKQTNFERYGVEHLFQSQYFQEYLKYLNFERHGVQNCMHRDDIKAKFVGICKIRDERRVLDVDENGLNSFERATLQQRITNEESGKWLLLSEKSDYELYRRSVWKYTNKQPIEFLDDIEKRGEHYHLDHKYSIFAGFRESIPPNIIGNINNLVILTRFDNISKGSDCSISKEELYRE